jgi:hypothetical protein
MGSTAPHAFFIASGYLVHHARGVNFVCRNCCRQCDCFPCAAGYVRAPCNPMEGLRGFDFDRRKWTADPEGARRICAYRLLGVVMCPPGCVRNHRIDCHQQERSGSAPTNTVNRLGTFLWVEQPVSVLGSWPFWLTWLSPRRPRSRTCWSSWPTESLRGRESLFWPACDRSVRPRNRHNPWAPACFSVSIQLSRFLGNCGESRESVQRELRDFCGNVFSVIIMPVWFRSAPVKCRRLVYPSSRTNAN